MLLPSEEVKPVCRVVCTIPKKVTTRKIESKGHLEYQVQELRGNVRRCDDIIDEKEKGIKDMKFNLDRQKRVSNNLRDRLDEHKELPGKIRRREDAIDEKREAIRQLEKNLSQEKRRSKSLRGELNDQEKEIEKQRQEVSAMSEKVTEHEQKIKTLQEAVAENNKFISKHFFIDQRLLLLESRFQENDSQLINALVSESIVGKNQKSKNQKPKNQKSL